MKKGIIALIISLLAVPAMAQHFLQMDDGLGHFSILKSQTTNALDIFLLPSGGGTLLTIPTPGSSSLVWQTAGNTLIAGQVFGSVLGNAFDVVMQANGVEKMRLVSGAGVTIGTGVANALRYNDGTQALGRILRSDALGQASWVDPASLTIVTTATGTAPITVNGDNAPHSGAITIALTQGSLTTSTPSITVGGTGKTVGSNITVDLTTGSVTSSGSITVGGTGKTVGSNITADLNLANPNTWTGAQTFNGANKIIYTDGNQGLNKVLKSDASGNASWGTVGTSSLSGGANDNILVWTGGAATWQNMNVGAGLVGNGVSTQLKLNVQHDATLTGDGDGIVLGINLTNPNNWTGQQTIIGANKFKYVDGNQAVNKVLISDATGQAAWSALGTSSIAPGGNNTFLVTNGASTVTWLGFNRNATLVGDGITTALGLNTANANNWTAQQTITLANGFKYVDGNQALNKVLVSDATGQASWSTIGASSITPGVNGNVLVTTGGVAAWQNLNIGTGLTGNGVTSTLDANIQHDASLTGAGTTASNLVLNVSNPNTWTGTQTFGGVALTPITQAALVANTDNYALSGSISNFRISSSAPVNLTGITGGVSGRVLRLQNVGANAITLKSQTTSVATNQFDLPGGADIILGPKAAVTFIYDGTLGFWEVVATN